MKYLWYFILIYLLPIVSSADTLIQNDSESINITQGNSEYETSCFLSSDGDPSARALDCARALGVYRKLNLEVPQSINQRVIQFQPGGSLHPLLRGQILDRLRLNRRAFQEDKVLARYGEERDFIGAENGPPSAFEICGLPRDSEGTPLPQYPTSFTNPDHSIRGTYSEVKGVLGCLETKSGLAGTRAEPLAQHYYCTFPGNSPEIRSCFTFQIRVSSSTRSNSHKNILKTNDSNDTFEVITKAKKEWLFAGTQKDFVDAKERKALPEHIITKVAKYCSVDGRAARLIDSSQSPPVTYWHKDFLEEFLDQAAVHEDLADTNGKLIAEYLLAKSLAEQDAKELLDISEIDVVRDENSLVKPPLCWVNQTQAAVFQLMLSPALPLFFDRENQRSILREYYGCAINEIEQKYKDIDSRITTGKKLRMRNFCPDDFDHWND